MNKYKFNFKGFNYNCLIKESTKNICNPIIMISGAFQDVKSWNKFIEKYTALSTVIIVDLPGTGDSDLLPYKYDFEFLSDTLYELVIKLKLNKIEIIAASYGTPIGILFTNKYPSLVSHLVLIGTVKKFPKKLIPKIEKSFTQIKENKIVEFSENVLGILMNNNKRNEIINYDLLYKIINRKILNLTNYDYLKYIENTKRVLYHKELKYNFTFNNPVLIFTGEYDSFTKPSYCKEIATMLNNVTYTTIKNADHLCGLEHFNTNIELITKFITNKELVHIENCNKIEILNQNIIPN